MPTIISGDGTITGLTTTGISAVQNLPTTGTITNLTTTTISDGTNSTSSTNCIQGSAKAWVNFNGGTATVTNSFNVSSVTRNSVGNYNVNFTTAMPNLNYVICGNATQSSGTFYQFGGLANSASQANVYSYQVTAAFQDSALMQVAIFSS